MIKLKDERKMELDRINEAKKKHDQIITTPARIDAQTFILVRKGKDEIKAVQEFKKAWKEFQDYDKQHAEPFLSK